MFVQNDLERTIFKHQSSRRYSYGRGSVRPALDQAPFRVAFCGHTRDEVDAVAEAQVDLWQSPNEVDGCYCGT